MEYLYTILVALAVLRTAQSLSCWKCQSRDDGQSLCADYFNDTKIRNSPRTYSSIDAQVPIEENCESFLASHITDKKPVCIKKVEIVNGIRHYTRKCGFIHVELPIEDCGKEAGEDPRVRIEFCQQCATDYCNTSNIPKATVYSLILTSIISILLLTQ